MFSNWPLVDPAFLPKTQLPQSFLQPHPPFSFVTRSYPTCVFSTFLLSQLSHSFGYYTLPLWLPPWVMMLLGLPRIVGEVLFGTLVDIYLRDTSPIGVNVFLFVLPLRVPVY